MVQYLDDPGCTYIVVEDPWPATKFGADRRSTLGYYKWMSSWVYYMLDKLAHPSVIYTVNTASTFRHSAYLIFASTTHDIETSLLLRRETRLSWSYPRELISFRYSVNIRGVRFSTLGMEKRYPTNIPTFSNTTTGTMVARRIVRTCQFSDIGSPLTFYDVIDNWIENHTFDGGEPPPRYRVPFKYPYPAASWATHADKACKDLAKALPTSRVKTPPPPSPPPSVRLYTTDY